MSHRSAELDESAHGCLSLRRDFTFPVPNLSDRNGEDSKNAHSERLLLYLFAIYVVIRQFLEPVQGSQECGHLRNESLFCTECVD